MLHIIYNPSAGRWRARKVRHDLECMLLARKIEHRFYATSDKGDASRIASELSKTPETSIIAMGGDGTLHEVLNGLCCPENVRLGVIPCGSGNDFCKGVGIPSKPIEALELILSQSAKPTDYMLCSGVRSLNVLGAGIDVEVLRYSYQARFLRGSLNYAVSLLRALTHFRFYHLRMRHEGHDGNHSTLVACVCNGRYIGGGIPICPEAVCDDGKLNIVTVENIRKRQIPMAFLKLMQGRILDQGFTRHVLTDSVRIDTDKPITIQIDGELYDNLPFEVQLVPNGIRVYRP